MARLRLIETLSHDIGDAWRSLRAARSTTAVVLLVMMLATGTTATVFSVVDAVSLRDLPFEQSDRLVSLDRMIAGEVSMSSYTAPDFLAIREHQQVFDGVAAIASGTLVLRRDGAIDPEILHTHRVTHEFFQVLRAYPQLGRPFTHQNEIDGGERVGVISYSLWQRRFGGTPDVLGRRIAAESGDIEVIGVMPRGFAYPVGAVQPAELWVPYVIPARERNARVSSYLRLVARLKDGVSMNAAQAQIDQIAAASESAGSALGPRPFVRTLHESMTGHARSSSLLLLAAVICVLMLAAANIANLLVVRATARTRELNVRVALGATRTQLARMLLAESLLVATLGTALGLGIAWWSIEGLRSLLPPDLPRLADVALNARVLLVAALTALATGVGVGVLPVVHSWRIRGRVSEDAGLTSTTAPRWQRLRATLLVGEITLTVVLLFGTALLLTSFARLMRVDLGLDYRNVMVVELRPASRASAGASPLTNVLANVSSVPGVVTAAAASGNIPFSLSTSTVPVSIPGRTLPPGATTSIAASQVSLNYFNVLRLPLRSGRQFSAEDVDRNAPVTILNETAARALFPGEDPIGQRVNVGFGEPQTVIGVVGDVRGSGPEHGTQPQAFNTIGRATRGTLLIKIAGDPAAILPKVKMAIWSEFPDLAIPQPRLLEDALSRLIAERRLLALLVAVFGVLGLAIAAAGIYGLMSFNVTQRTREIGIRLALGAVPAAILVSQLRGAAVHVAIGGTLGFGMVRWMSELAEKFAFRVDPTDVWLYAAAGTVLLVTAFAAAAVPARRAARVDPVIALRSE